MMDNSATYNNSNTCTRNRNPHKDCRKKSSLCGCHQYNAIMKGTCILSLVMNVILCAVLAYITVLLVKFRVAQESAGPVYCSQQHSVSFESKFTPKSDIFNDLTSSEIEAVVSTLFANKTLKLAKPEQVPDLMTNFVYSIELRTPSKEQVLNFIDNNGPRPEREARVVVFSPEESPSVVREYIVGSLPNPSHIYTSETKKTKIPFRLRQFSYLELWKIYQFLYVLEDFDKILRDSYNASLFNCIVSGKKRCMSLHKTPLPYAVSKRRQIWLSLYYDIEYYSLYPVDMHLLVDIHSLNTSQWFIEKVLYAGQTYMGYDSFMQGYFKGSIQKTGTLFPEPPSNGNYFSSLSTLNWTAKKGQTRKRHPKQFDPDGHRYTAKGQHVKFQGWSFYWKVQLANGLYLMDVRFKGERIIYEISLQDILVTYTGNSPVFNTGEYSESLSGLGVSLTGLVPGVDCPGHATFLNVLISNEEFLTGGRYPNALCIFEHNAATPLRRFYSNSPGHSGIFYGGLVSTTLILRTIISVSNFNYIVDYVFYENGAIEVKITPTGYILTSIKDHSYPNYGANIRLNITAPVYLQLFHFKIDFDISGTKNKYAIMELEHQNTSSRLGQSISVPNYFLNQKVIETEQESVYIYNAQKPVEHIFSSDKAEKREKAYRLSSKHWKSQIFPRDIGPSWSRYNLAVTRQKDSEERSSSMYASIDAGEPVIDFKTFLEDNENIIDQDLVAWITVGDHHIPTLEDIPNIITAGREISFTLSPFNYFDKDQSIKSHDSVYMSPKDPLNLKKGLNIETDAEFQNRPCTPELFDIWSLENNSSAVFMSAP